jgi:hypothetical protein
LKTINNWITQGIKISCRHKRSLYILNRRSNNPHIRTHYNKYCKTLSRVIKEAKREYYFRLIKKAVKLKTTWNMIKHESGKLQQMEQIPPVLINNEKINDPQTNCRCLQYFFLKIADNLDLHRETRDDAISFLKNAFPKNFPDFKIIPTTETEIKSIIHSLKAKNSTDYGEIVSKTLKTCASLISHPLTHICKHSLLMGTFPNCLKISHSTKEVTKPTCQTIDQFHY